MIEVLDAKIFLIAVTVLVGLGVFFGALLGFAAEYFTSEQDPVVEQIDQLLPRQQDKQSI